jgi:hypothetical protein
MLKNTTTLVLGLCILSASTAMASNNGFGDGRGFDDLRRRMQSEMANPNGFYQTAGRQLDAQLVNRRDNTNIFGQLEVQLQQMQGGNNNNARMQFPVQQRADLQRIQDVQRQIAPIQPEANYVAPRPYAVEQAAHAQPQHNNNSVIGIDHEVRNAVQYAITSNELDRAFRVINKLPADQRLAFANELKEIMIDTPFSYRGKLLDVIFAYESITLAELKDLKEALPLLWGAIVGQDVPDHYGPDRMNAAIKYMETHVMPRAVREAEEAEEALKQLEALRLAEAQHLEAARKAEADRLAEVQRAEAARKAEADRLAEAQRLEAARKAEADRLAEVQRAEAARKAEADRLAEVQRAEAARKAEAAKPVVIPAPAMAPQFIPAAPREGLDVYSLKEELGNLILKGEAKMMISHATLISWLYTEEGQSDLHRFIALNNALSRAGVAPHQYIDPEHPGAVIQAIEILLAQMRKI